MKSEEVMIKKKTISILGPTASGKTSLSIELAKKIGGEVISCDSMQLYREMNIGTATPTVLEMDGVPHHLLDIINPEDEFSAADYAEKCAEAIEDIISRRKIPIICGGTGMYHDAVMKINSFTEGGKNDTLRDELYLYAEKFGNEALHARLYEIDRASAESIHPNNVKRVVRAIEVYETTGKTKTETDLEQISGESRFEDCKFVIDYSHRAILYDRIDKRVDVMIAEGLENEARNILCTGRNISKTAAQAIGYKEFLPYFNSEATLEEVTNTIKLATRHYAKRQIMWFRRDTEAYRLVPDRVTAGMQDVVSEDSLLSSKTLVRSAVNLCEEALIHITKFGIA